jgi:hypothetical protein
MLTTLKATVEGDKLHWQEAPGDALPANQPVEVLVTILNGQGDGDSAAAHGRRRVAALQKLVALNGLSGISDPVQWQRELREDRDLPGRAP